MLGAPQAKVVWSAPTKSRFYYLFWLLELMPGHLRRSILRILVLNPTHEISWSRSGFFSLRGRILRAGAPAPLCFLVFVFSPPPSALEGPGRPLNERLKTLRPVRPAERANEAHAAHRLCMAAEMTREAHLQCTSHHRVLSWRMAASCVCLWLWSVASAVGTRTVAMTYVLKNFPNPTPGLPPRSLTASRRTPCL